MAFEKYTQCYNYLDSGEKPFHIDELLSIVLGAAGPAGVAALISFALGAFVLGGFAITIAFISAIATVAELWLNQRLVCLTGVRCAVGTVDSDPNRGNLGAFDNDEFFDVILMPHRKEDNVGPEDAAADLRTVEQDNAPKNYLSKDGLQGEALLTAVTESGDLPYDQTKNEVKTLHCEAEGAFWVRMREWAWLMGLVLGAASAVGAAVGATVAAALCALGPILCILGILLGLLIWAIATAIGAAVVAGIMAIIFEASKGDVEDANVGDTEQGPIKAGDRVIVVGEHVYDGFHEGWNEFHPLMTVAKLNDTESSQYLQWDPDFPTGGTLPADTDDMPATIKNIEISDMKIGLESDKFSARAQWMWDKYCGMMTEASDPDTRKKQKRDEHQWTIHPDVDGCDEQEEPPVPH